MSDNLRILIVEDVPCDAELMEYDLQNAKAYGVIFGRSGMNEK